MTETDQKRKKEDYEFYKAHGLCVKCHKEKAMSGKTMCLQRLCDRREQDRARYQKMGKTKKQKRMENNNARKERLKKEGLCIECGKRRARAGGVRCSTCLSKIRRRAAKRRLAEGRVPQGMRGAGDTCYFCGGRSSLGIRSAKSIMRSVRRI